MALTFGELLKKERNSKGMSLQALSKKCNIEASYINRLEKGERTNPSFTTVCALSDALELNGQEVLQSFGYESLGISPSYEGNEEKGLPFTHDEKSQLKEIYSIVESYVTSTGSVSGYIPKMLLLLETLRENYQKRQASITETNQ